MAVVFCLWCVAALLGFSVLAVAFAGRKSATAMIYTACLIVSAALLAETMAHLVGGADTAGLILPLGLPWVGAHFRVDALSAAFLVVVNLGAAGASLYGLGYGRHESAPARVLPFFPVFLAAMNLVVLADDAFSFLASWEF